MVLTQHDGLEHFVQAFLTNTFNSRVETRTSAANAMSSLYDKGVFMIKGQQPLRKGSDAEPSRAVKKEASRAEFKRGTEDEAEFENAAQAVVFQHYVEQAYELLASATSEIILTYVDPKFRTAAYPQGVIHHLQSTGTSARTSSSSSFKACRSLRCTYRLFRPRIFSAFL